VALQSKYTMEQTKLTRDEWNAIELPVSPEEKDIFMFIRTAFKDIHHILHRCISTYTFLKITPSKELDLHLAHFYFKSCDLPPLEKVKLKKGDQIRLQSGKKLPSDVYEMILLHMCSTKAYFHLDRMLSLQVKHPNPYVVEHCKKVLSTYTPNLKALTMNAVSLLEHNPCDHYTPIELYSHQKDLFTLFQEPNKLVLYTAHTGMGKTLSPLGLAEKYKVIYVCAARHIALAFATACCSSHIKFAVAFGCESEEDVRLHYSAAKKFTVDRRSGGIRNVDNSRGEDVDVIISDIHSCTFAESYMLKFNEKDNILLYIDEPTITMNHEEHPLHAHLQSMWKSTVVPNIVFSSATLPDIDYSEITRLPVHKIRSHDTDRTVQVVSPEHTVVLPHQECATYADLQQLIQHLTKNPVLLKYIDLQSILTFLQNEPIPFTTMKEITIPSIKAWYISTLKTISESAWTTIVHTKRTVPSTIDLCAKDAWTCSYGPTIYLADNVHKIAAYCLKTAQIPESILNELMVQLGRNTSISEKIAKLEMDMEDKNKDSEKEKKMADDRVSAEVRKIQKEIEALQAYIQPITLPDVHIPNKKDHLLRYGNEDKLPIAFTSDVEIHTIEKILGTDIEPSWKVLLMLGIGVFSTGVPPKYLEIIKDLATRQKLYLIIANTHYIYGTNYPFANAYIAKDLTAMTQEELIQAMGRVGRNKRVPYSIRIRDSSIVQKLFLPQPSPEGKKMLELFHK